MAGTALMMIAGTAVLTATSLCCATAAWVARSRRRRRSEVRSWSILAAFMLAFALYRAGGLEYALTDHLRNAAHTDGVYAGRRIWQAVTISFALLVMIGLALPVIRRRSWPIERRVAIVAAEGYAGLSLVRVISLHLTDHVLYRNVGPVRINWAVEAIVLGLIAFSAIVSTVWSRKI